MEINDTTFCVFAGFRMFGLAPYTIVRNKTGGIVDFALNRWLCVYSCLILIVFGCLANYIIFETVDYSVYFA